MLVQQPTRPHFQGHTYGCLAGMLTAIKACWSLTKAQLDERVHLAWVYTKTLLQGPADELQQLLVLLNCDEVLSLCSEPMPQP